ncbi:hypothetical protein J6I90_06420 [Pseudidiomarina sp. 1APP75-32.1]|uniref:UDP-3-O-(3-hydroxymyristoyl)glucosamine N-acyltransferase n=1 Tax=Pseudidiomarina terrestris TaxID=2820060 RepID=A0AAW7QWE8_9GAMM|nr:MULTISPECIES: UDP-3-O-(3-hydroxymyristoyl)glucosamine N-acyltransferase [unclassified Pseudidiomarina]MDN7124511.1 hypothetical protein [Pseudidiomarina sp. 1APP75-32.1]MDN7129198.1 hypothetical protein [Pseudidiomarina sp. 1APR75-15]
MARYFLKPINLRQVAQKYGLKVDFDATVLGVSDSNVGASDTITDYIKGDLPAKGTILITKKAIEGYRCVLSDNPSEDFYCLINEFSKSIGFTPLYNSKVHESVIIGQNVVIEKGVEIGQNTTIEHNVVIHSGTSIGANCIIRSGAVIGGEGYGFVIDSEQRYLRQPFVGGVVIREEVEVGYNSAIVRGSINNTILGTGVKLDNLVHIAHDCVIGDYSTVTAGVTFCGYVVVGKNVRFAPQSTVKQRIHIGDNAIVGLGAVVVKNIVAGDVVVGNPAKPLIK